MKQLEVRDAILHEAWDHFQTRVSMIDYCAGVAVMEYCSEFLKNWHQSYTHGELLGYMFDYNQMSEGHVYWHNVEVMLDEG